nr:MAG TPA: hypothetical protein [Caudoviricetes sp.]DAN03184.1 MAG TPA: hypothetical protein [Caudoviricetes sp.]
MKYYLIDENIRSVIPFCDLFPFALTVINHGVKQSPPPRIFARKFLRKQTVDSPAWRCGTVKGKRKG